MSDKRQMSWETDSAEGKQSQADGGRPRLLVVGCGNTLAGDDGAGVRIVEGLRAGAAASPLNGLRFVLAGTLGVELLDHFAAAGIVLIVDAMISGDTPGTVRLLRIDGSEFAGGALTSNSVHGWGLGEVLGLARALGRRLPRIFVLGIEPESTVIGAGLSAGVARAVDQVISQFPEIAARIFRDSDTGPEPLFLLKAGAAKAVH